MSKSWGGLFFLDRLRYFNHIKSPPWKEHIFKDFEKKKAFLASKSHFLGQKRLVFLGGGPKVLREDFE